MPPPIVAHQDIAAVAVPGCYIHKRLSGDDEGDNDDDDDDDDDDDCYLLLSLLLKTFSKCQCGSCNVLARASFFQDVAYLPGGTASKNPVSFIFYPDYENIKVLQLKSYVRL